MNRNIFYVVTIAAVTAFSLAGCEFGKFPLVLDSSVASRTVRVDIDPPGPMTVDETLTVDISELKDVASESVDSIKFYNLTLLADNNTSPADAKASGTMTVNGISLITLDNISLSEFSRERSIFDKDLLTKGFQYHSGGILFLLSALKTQSPSILTFNAVLTSGADSLHFDFKVKVYGQVFTNTD